jgi:hypothetical protein
MDRKTNADQPSSDQQRELINAEEFSTRLFELCFKSRFSRLPRKQRDQHILFKSMTLMFEKDAVYAERDVNYRLKVWQADIGRSLRVDHVRLRRWLVDSNYLERDNRGSRYQIATEGPAQDMFEPDVDDIDIYKTIGIGMKVAQERKEEYLQRED